jgi:hypothetical protein
MDKKIRIISGEHVLEAELNSSKTAAGIFGSLPLKGNASRWGKELYFIIPFSGEYEDPVEVVQAGDIAYWPPGRAFCIFWGTTPASTGNEIRPASEVNIVGRVTSGLEILQQEGILSGDPLVIESMTGDKNQ